MQMTTGLTEDVGVCVVALAYAGSKAVFPKVVVPSAFSQSQ